MHKPEVACLLHAAAGSQVSCKVGPWEISLALRKAPVLGVAARLLPSRAAPRPPCLLPEGPGARGQRSLPPLAPQCWVLVDPGLGPHRAKTSQAPWGDAPGLGGRWRMGGRWEGRPWLFDVFMTLVLRKGGQILLEATAWPSPPLSSGVIEGSSRGGVWGHGALG